jgi:hypothetical protein
VARFGRVAALFAVLTVVMTWPQATRLATSAEGHQDVFFNMWRVAWVAHAIATSPLHVLDGNIFYPEPRTLTFSDAMPVEASIAAPLLWAAIPPVLVHNLLLLAGIVLSASGIAMLAASLTGSRAAGITAGIVFAFAPYRFEHYMHMELQWTVWIPWAFWALHRTFETGSRRHAGLVGTFVALQFMSSIYYGMFLGTLLGLSAALLLCATRKDDLKSRLSALGIAAATAAILVAPYAVPYAATKQRVGPRSEGQVLTFSARPSSYLVATDTNYLYGQRSSRRGRPERRLFPGVLPVLLAITGLLLRRPSVEAMVYLLALVAAFEMSLGFYGYTFSVLYHHVPVFDALRAPARLGIFVVFFLAILAAYGHAALETAIAGRARWVLLVAISVVLLLEYWVAPLRLAPFPNEPPPLYAWLAKQPRGVVTEFPLPTVDTLPGNEPRYAYMSTFHWMPTTNGYSGYYPPSYLTRLEILRSMPDDSALQALAREGVRYVIVHPALYQSADGNRVVTAIVRSPLFAELGRFEDGLGTAVVFTPRH